MKVEEHGRGPRVFGLLAEFDDPQKLLRATRRTWRAGYRRIDAYTPYPIEELWEAMGKHKSRLPLIVLIGGICGCIGGFLLQYWVSTSAYPLNIGGRPLNSWPAFIPVTFECTILAAGISAVLGMLALNGLPQPYHPVFNVERFSLASRDSYFLIIAADDELFDGDSTEAHLWELGPSEVTKVDF